jgi:hypothetical protein
MRIWSLHPSYLDAKGLVALWRETLLAKHVLEDRTKGYRNHPQLTRFKACIDPLSGINHYLAVVYEEAQNRGYAFDKNKIEWGYSPCNLLVTNGQIKYEMSHLLNKLNARDPQRFLQLKNKRKLLPHPIFTIIDGEIEKWEIR